VRPRRIAESGINLRDAILLASRDLTQAGRTIEANPKEYKTFGLWPTRATVSFDIQAIHGNEGKAEISVAPPQIPVGGIFGWSASRQIQKGNHIEIEFTPRE
jgi:hypothetical protein